MKFVGEKMLKKRLVHYAKSTSITECLFYLALFVYYGALMLYSTGITLVPKYPVSKAICIVVLLILVLRLGLLSRIDTKNAVRFIPTVLIAFIADVQSGNYVLMTTMVALLFAGSKYSLHSILKFSLVVITGLILLVFALVFVRVIPFDFHYRNNSTIIRYNLGFKYPTFLAHFLLTLYLLVGYLYMESLKKIHFLVAGALSLLVFWLTDTKVVLVQSLLFVAVVWYYRCYQPKKKRYSQIIQIKPIVKQVVVSSPVWATGIFVGMSLWRQTDNVMVKAIDSLLTGRLYYTGKAFVDYTLTLFGQRMPFDTGFINGERGANYFFIDSSFINMLFTQGVVFFVCIMCLCMYMLNKAYDTDKKMLVVLLFVMCHSLFDTQLLELHFTPFWFFVLSTPERLEEIVDET